MCRTINGSSFLYMCPKYMHNIHNAHWEYVTEDSPPTREDVELFVKLRDEFSLIPDDKIMVKLFENAEMKYVTIYPGITHTETHHNEVTSLSLPMHCPFHFVFLDVLNLDRHTQQHNIYNETECSLKIPALCSFT